MSIVTRKYLKDCLLWTGSAEECEFLHEGIQLATIRNKVAALRRAPDRTPAEQEWLDGLEKTLVDPSGIQDL